MSNRLGVKSTVLPFRVRYADGVTEDYGQGEPLFTLVFKTEKAFGSFLTNPSLGFGEGYIQGEVDVVGNIQDLMNAYFHAKFQKWFLFRVGVSMLPWTINRYLRLLLNSREWSSKAIKAHYDHPSILYQLMLDPQNSGHRQYSCAYFEKPDMTLEQAQQAKARLTCNDLHLQPGQTLLDVGSGWGGLAFYAAKEYGVRVYGCTLSPNQLEWSRSMAAEFGIGDRCMFELVDVRDLVPGSAKYPKGWPSLFDKMVSVGMAEHVGRFRFNKYMATCFALLQKNGLFLLHTITRNRRFIGDPFTLKHIFPDYDIPWDVDVYRHAARVGFQVGRINKIGPHYATTLRHWAENSVENPDHWACIESEFKRLNPDKDPKVFKRLWLLYLHTAEACFFPSNNDLGVTRVVLTKNS